MTEARRRKRWAYRHFGRRGIVLFVLGALWVLIGVGYAVERVDRFSRPGPGGALQFMDSVYPSYVWLLGGAMAMFCGAIRYKREYDDVGFNGLLLPPFIWAVTYGWSAIAYSISDGQQGRQTAWIAAIIFLAVALIVLFIARWPDPDEPHAARDYRRVVHK